MKEINYRANMTTRDAPEIKKLGVIGFNGEMTPFVLNGRLMRAETVSHGDVETLVFNSYCVIRDVKTGECGAPFAHGFNFFSAFCENETVYVFGTSAKADGSWGGDTVRLFRSDDLVNWSEKEAIRREGWTLYNTSVCRGEDGYVMAIEVGEPEQYTGKRFTEFFAVSKDLTNWELMPLDTCYTKQRYNACPALRYHGGYYYLICLEALPLGRYAPYIYRTKDFETWEIGLHNPIMHVSREDRTPRKGIGFTPEELEKIRSYLNINNCDIDLCEFQGKTHINYLTGDQLGFYCMCEAQYNGPLGEFLEAFFK